MLQKYDLESKLYFITDAQTPFYVDVINAGAKIIQLRDKISNDIELLRKAERMRSITFRKGAIFIINDRVDIAQEVGADGVHLGQEDVSVEEAREIIGKSGIIGVSTHDIKQAESAKNVDYVAIGPIFHTKTKKTILKPVGVELIKQARGKIEVPIIAIGGINEANIAYVLDAGADTIAVSSCITNADDPVSVTENLVETISKRNVLI